MLFGWRVVVNKNEWVTFNRLRTAFNQSLLDLDYGDWGRILVRCESLSDKSSELLSVLLVCLKPIKLFRTFFFFLFGFRFFVLRLQFLFRLWFHFVFFIWFIAFFLIRFLLLALGLTFLTAFILNLFGNRFWLLEFLFFKIVTSLLQPQSKPFCWVLRNVIGPFNNNVPT